MLCSEKQRTSSKAKKKSLCLVSILARNNPGAQNKTLPTPPVRPQMQISHDMVGSSTGRSSLDDLFRLFMPVSSPFQEMLLRGPGKSCGMGIKKEPLVALPFPSLRAPPLLWLPSPSPWSEDRLLLSCRAPGP
jgi:hypothetical protein